VNKSDIFTLLAIAAAIILFVDFTPPMQVLDAVIVFLAAVWAVLTVYKWVRKPKDGGDKE
jgi:divalent metal cation (Fe/Co/Zn/Cd) transporter